MSSAKVTLRQADTLNPGDQTRLGSHGDSWANVIAVLRFDPPKGSKGYRARVNLATLGPGVLPGVGFEEDAPYGITELDSRELLVITRDKAQRRVHRLARDEVIGIHK